MNPSLSNAPGDAVGFLSGFGANKAFNKSRQKSRKVTRRGWNTLTVQQKSSIKHSFIIICLRVSATLRAALDDATWAGEHLQPADTFGSSSVLVLFGEQTDFKDDCSECSVFPSEVARSFARSNDFTAVIWISPVNYSVILRQQSLLSRDNEIMDVVITKKQNRCCNNRLYSSSFWFLYILIVCSSRKLQKNKSSPAVLTVNCQLGWNHFPVSPEVSHQPFVFLR